MPFTPTQIAEKLQWANAWSLDCNTLGTSVSYQVRSHFCTTSSSETSSRRSIPLHSAENMGSVGAKRATPRALCSTCPLAAPFSCNGSPSHAASVLGETSHRTADCLERPPALLSRCTGQSPCAPAEHIASAVGETGSTDPTAPQQLQKGACSLRTFLGAWWLAQMALLGT